MAAMTCPYCGAYADFAVKHHFQSMVAGAFEHYGVWTCAACGQPVIGLIGNNTEPVDYHPRSGAKRDFPDVPTAIADDAREAFRCYSIDSFRASAAMARRALQATAHDKGAPDKTLVAQIDWLADNDHITAQMKEVAHQIRLGGNMGAHPDHDGLRAVGQAEAEAILLFLLDFFRYVYEIPASLTRLGGSSGITT